MPIKFSFRKLPVDESGKAYDSLEAFKSALLVSNLGISDEAAKMVVHEKDLVVEILQINENSLPAARGQKRPRKPKTVPASEDTTKAA